MKINPNDIDNFIKNTISNISAILVYGPDNGLVKERVKAITSKILPGNIDSLRLIEFSYEKIKDDLRPLIDNIFSLNLSRQKLLIRVSNCAPAIAATLSEALNNYKGENVILLYAGDLAPTSSLRKFFENSKKHVSIACYKDEQATIKKLIINKLNQHGYNISPLALQAMENFIGGDRMLILNEIEKLITYMGEHKNISLDDISSVITNSNIVTIDDFCQNIAQKKPAQAVQLFQSLMAENISLIALLRSLNKYFLRLYQVKFATMKNIPIAQAMNQLNPPVFFKNAVSFQNHLKIWTINELTNAIKIFAELEAKCKKTGVPAELICEHHFLKLIQS
jgi:DNA polymerase-3 subunit delta